MVKFAKNGYADGTSFLFFLWCRQAFYFLAVWLLTQVYSASSCLKVFFSNFG